MVMLLEALMDIPLFKGVDGKEYSFSKGEIKFVPKIHAEGLILKNVAIQHETVYFRIKNKEHFDELFQEIVKEKKDHLIHWIDDKTIIASKKDVILSLLFHQLKETGSVIEIDPAVEDLNGIGVVNDSTEVYIEDTFAEYVSVIKKEDSNALAFKKEYSVLTGHIDKSTGKTKSSFPIAIINIGKDPIRHGLQEVYLQKITSETLDFITKYPIPESHGFNPGGFIKKIGATYGVIHEYSEERLSKYKEPIEMWHELFSNCYEPALPIPKEEIKQCTDIEKVIDMAVAAGLKIDPNIKLVMCSEIPKINPNRIDPEEYMPYAPNAMCITNSKTGKSTTAARISQNVIRDPTPANLLGFSTSDKTHIGALDNQVDAAFIDELTESVEMEAANGLSNYMETGSTKRARGEGVEVRGYAPIVFLGNPKSFDRNASSIELYEIFYETLKYATGNPIAFASRLGILIFNSDLKTVNGNKIENSLSKKALKVLKTIQQMTRDDFTKLFKDKQIREWLNTPYDAVYLDMIDEVARDVPLHDTQSFMKGFKDGYRHVRGTALHLAFYYNIGRYAKGGDDKPTKNEFMEECELQFKILCNLNIDSLRRIASMQITPDIVANRVIELPDYAKYLLQAICNFGDELPERIPFESLKSGFDVIEGIDTKSSFANFGRFKQLIYRKKKDSLNNLLSFFGYKVVEVNETRIIVIENRLLTSITQEVIQTLKINFSYKWLQQKNIRQQAVAIVANVVTPLSGKNGTSNIWAFSDKHDLKTTSYNDYNNYNTTTNTDNSVVDMYPLKPKLINDVELIKNIKKFAKRSDQKENILQRNYRSFVYGFAATLSGFPDIQELMGTVQHLAERGELVS